MTATVCRARLVAPRHLSALAVVMFMAVHVAVAVGHPLGNFSTNHYVRIRVSLDEVTIRYVVDMAEIAAFQEIVAATGGSSTSWSEALRDAYLARTAARYLEGLRLAIDGAGVPLRLLATSMETPEGLGGQSTLRVGCEIAGPIGAFRDGARFSFEDTNHPGRAGWHEVVVEAGVGVEIFDSSAFASGLSDELRTYPTDVLMAPLQERSAQWSVTSGPLPVGAKPPSPRVLAPVETPGTRERFAALFGVPALPTEVAFFGVLLAFALGGLHAFAFPQAAVPGTAPRHVTVAAAVLLSLRVTIAEISGVVPLALVALIGAEYVLPERFFPAVGIVGGGSIALIGVSLLIRRLREIPPRGERERERVAAFLPSSSLLVVLLAGIAFRRVGYGFVLIGAFSLGLLAALIVSLGTVRDRIPAALRFPVLASALIIAAVGAAICVEALSRLRPL